MAARRDSNIWYNRIQENNLQMAVASLPIVPTPAKPESPLAVLARMNRPRFILRYKEDSGFGPGYRLADIEQSMHPVDFQEFIADIRPVGRIDGHVIIYALDYIQWMIRKENE